MSQNTFSSSPAWSLIALSAACGQAAGTRPHEMGAAQHRAAADAEQAQAAGHGAEYNPKARATERTCDPSLSQPPAYSPNSSGASHAYPTPPSSPYAVCWMDTINPTAEHRREAQEHRDRAEQHRHASAALVAAEESACVGLAEAERDLSPFAHAGDIQSVSPLKEEQLPEGRAANSEGRMVGARVAFRAVRGLTAPWLQRIVDCHLARNAALGHDVASHEMGYCPLTLRGVSARVREGAAGFVVDVEADDPTTAGQVWQRAQHLLPAR